jgi:hypothetical protein
VVGIAVAVSATVRVSRLRAAILTGRTGPGGAAPIDPKALRHVAVVRYDAFGDMGGQLSHSVALLDAAGDGVVLTTINGRTEARSYAKDVSGGTSTHPLSPEERQSLDAALGRRR